MTAAQWTEISSWGLLLWAISASVVLLVQALAWPEDKQEWSAIAAVGLLCLLLWRTFVAYRFGIPLGGTEQGIVVFTIGALGWGWFGFCTWEVNRGLYLRRIRWLWRRLRRRS